MFSGILKKKKDTPRIERDSSSIVIVKSSQRALEARWTPRHQRNDDKKMTRLQGGLTRRVGILNTWDSNTYIDVTGRLDDFVAAQTGGSSWRHGRVGGVRPTTRRQKKGSCEHIFGAYTIWLFGARRRRVLGQRDAFYLSRACARWFATAILVSFDSPCGLLVWIWSQVLQREFQWIKERRETRDREK